MIRLTALLLFAFVPVIIYSQAKTVTPPPESASSAEQQKWLVNALAKYASYETPAMSIKISAPKIERCVLTYTRTKKIGSTSETTLIVTTRTDKIKDNMSIDLTNLHTPSIKLSDHIFPELSTLSFRVSRNETNFRDFEIVVQQPAADAIKTTLERVAWSCGPTH